MSPTSEPKLTTYPLPSYIYKILPSPPPTPIPPVLPLSDLDAQDGFIHLSTAAQIPLTASLFFASAHELWLLKVDTRKTEGVYRWASTDGTGARKWADLGSANVVGSRTVKRAEGQTWEDALKVPREEGWLVDE
ncbi:hypothetical protein C8T65DRAFT_707765 [Cerioporus squamosus]|nr:hypothetical protein C8T65DRAFT_707765 [Cerioporus squamosus]